MTAIALLLTLASAAAAGHGTEHHGIDPRILLVQLLGFGILAFIIGKFAVPPLARLLRGRQDRIREAFERIERDLAAAAAAKADAERKRKGADESAAEVVDRAAREGARLRDQVLREAADAARAIKGKAALEATIERDKMLLEFRSEVVDSALRGAERVVSEAMDQATQDALVARFLSDLEKVRAVERVRDTV